MRKRNAVYLVVGIVLVLGAAAGLVVFGFGRNAPPSARAVPVIPGLADRLDDLAWVRLARGDAKIDFSNVAGRWVLVGKGNYPADRAMIRRLFTGLSGLVRVEPHPAKPEPNAAGDDAHIDDPATGRSTLVALRSRTGDMVAELTVGDARPGAEGRLPVQKSGEESPRLARGSLDLPMDTLAWLDRDIVDIPSSRIASVTRAGEAGPAIVLRRDRPEDRLALPGLSASSAPDAADPAGLSAALAGLRLDDVKPASGVDAPDKTAAAEFVTFDGLAITLRLIEDGGADWVAVRAAGSGPSEAESHAINDRVARWVYAIPADRAKRLRIGDGDASDRTKGAAHVR